MPDQTLLLQTLSRFAQALPLPYDLEAILSDLTDSVVAVLGLTGSGVTLAENGQLVVAAAAGKGLAELEHVQEEFQAGPCVDAFTTGEVVTVTDLSAVTDRWPQYIDVAQRLGVSSVAGIPMKLADQSFGALNMYAATPRTWDEDDVNAAHVLADVATSYLVNGSKVRQLEQLTEQLQHALDSRVIIEQAKGVVAARDGISVEEAFHRIRGHARRHNTTVRTVADAIVNVGLHV
jgi:transcriptional regulator with GAF, ATPase, and Fis domain